MPFGAGRIIEFQTYKLMEYEDSIMGDNKKSIDSSLVYTYLSISNIYLLTKKSKDASS